MKLEVGMYVRTEWGTIQKIKEKRDYCKCIADDLEEEPYYLNVNQSCQGYELIKKASHNIIDLIEEGDYVNGYKVYHIDYAWNDSTRLVPYVDCIKNNYVNEIKSIVTKEQFESIKYSLEG